MTPPNTLWIVGQVKDSPAQWEFQGVYSTEEKAVAACRTHRYFVARVELDEPLPHETSQWKVGERQAYYPLGEYLAGQADGVNA